MRVRGSGGYRSIKSFALIVIGLFVVDFARRVLLWKKRLDFELQG